MFIAPLASTRISVNCVGLSEVLQSHLTDIHPWYSHPGQIQGNIAQWGKWGVHMDIVISLRILFNIIFVSASVSHCQSIIWIVLLFAAIHRAEYTITSNF